MNKKKIMIAVTILLIVTITYFIYTILRAKSDVPEETEKTYISKKIEDDCTEEYIALQTAETVSVEEKVSANALLVLKKYYKKCDHTINEYVELPKEIVNMQEEEVKKQYPDWEVIGFSADKVTLYKEFDDVCGEHFKLKIEEGKVVVYLLNNDGTESVYEKTNISSEYLTETDLINMQQGIEIYGREELNKIIEDFE